jgi:hypothetical protein
MKVILEKWNLKVMDNRLFDGEKYDIQGFLGKHLGLSDEEMFNKEGLTSCYSQLPKELEWLLQPCSWTDGSKFGSVQTMLWFLNDSQKYTQKQKMDNFTKLFKRLGIEIEWI